MIVAHLADLHLGYEAFERSERGRNVRERDVAVAFQRAIKGILRAAPDLILIVGDVFDRPDPPAGAFLALGRGLETLRASLPKSTVLMVGGARDVGPSPGQPGPLAAMDAFPNVESADSTVRSVYIAALDTRVLLLPYPTLREAPIPSIRRDSKARWNILALPARVGDTGPEVALDQWDYIALGTSHVAARYADHAHDPGSLERIDPDPWAGIDAPKGFLVVDLERGTVVRHPVEGRPTVALAQVRVDSGAGGGGLTGKVREVAEEVPGGLEGRIVRLPLSGAGALALSELESGVLGELRKRTLHLDVRPETRTRPQGPVDSGGDKADEVKGRGPIMVGSSVDLSAVSWPGGFRLIPPARASGEGLVALVWEGRTALNRVVNATLRGDDHLRQAAAAEDGEERPLRMCWARQGTSDLEEFADGCAHSLAELAGVHQLSEEIGALGFPVPMEDSVDRAERIDEIERELSAARTRLAALESVGVELEAAEADEQRLRGESAEAAGDAEAAVMEWLRERQDAETTLNAYRDRVREMKRRIVDLEEKAGDAPCPTCGRPLAEHFSAAVAALREEYDGIVQDGRWWRRRWDQLAEKAPEVQQREVIVVRLHADLEEAGERVHRARLGLREQDELRARESLLVRRSAFLMGESPGLEDHDLDRAIALRRDWLTGMAEARERLASRASRYLVQITSGRFPGFEVTTLGVVAPIGMTVTERSPAGVAAAFLALELAFAELVAAASEGRVGVRGLILAGTLDALSPDSRVRATAMLAELSEAHGGMLVLLTPRAFGGTREYFDSAVEMTRDGGTRWATRSLPAGMARIRLLSP